ncbi:MAG: glycosyl hydrolase family 28-related protein [Bacteriovoracaceae bacterium]
MKNVPVIRYTLFLLLSYFSVVFKAEATPWRSSLYPYNWQPGTKDQSGRFLHDFSYAGYRKGEVAIPINPPGLTYNVFTGFGADPYGKYNSTPEIQAAINAASSAGGGIVYIPPGYYKIDGELVVTSSKVVIRGAGPTLTKLRFSSTPSSLAHIGFYGNALSGPELFLAQDAENLSTMIKIQNASSLRVGDDISIGWKITDNFIDEHKMSGIWSIRRDFWWPIFQRKIVAINTRVTPNVVYIDIPIRYNVKTRDFASIRKVTGYLEESGIENLGISNVTSYVKAWTKNGVTAIVLSSVKNGWVKNIKSFSPPEDKSQLYHLQSTGIKVEYSKNVTVTNSQMEGSQNRGANANGYLFKITNSNEILIRDSAGFRGRHNFIQSGDFGTTGCVFLRVDSRDSRGFQSVMDAVGMPYFSEYHHSLAMANLVDQSTLYDGWLAYNRGMESSGSGHTSSQNVFWNTKNGTILSYQYGYGYVIGTTNTSVSINASSALSHYAKDTSPVDFIEGIGQGAGLIPQSLYEDQLTQRLVRLRNAPVMENPNNNGLQNAVRFKNTDTGSIPSSNIRSKGL